MHIYKLNCGNIKFNKLNFAIQNPISFRANKTEDSFELSPEAQTGKIIQKIESEIQCLLDSNAQLEKEKARIAKDIEILLALAQVSFSDAELKNISRLCSKRQKGSEVYFVKKIMEILSSKPDGYWLSNSTGLTLKNKIKRVPLEAVSYEKYGELIKMRVNTLIDELSQKDERLNAQIEQNEKLIAEKKKQIEDIEYFPNFATLYCEDQEKVGGGLKIHLAQELGCVINLDDPQYSNFSSGAKKIIQNQLEKLQGSQKWPINSQQNHDYLAKFNNFEVFSSKEIEAFFGSCDIADIFPKASSKEVGLETLILFPNDDDCTRAIVDLKSKKTKTKKMLLGENRFDAEQMPFVYEKYDKEDQNAKINFMFINPENELNHSIINGGRKLREYFSGIPFVYDSKSWGTVLDTDNPENCQLLKNVHPLYPRKSNYAHRQLCIETFEVIDVPVAYLEKLGFSDQNSLIGLIKSGKLDGKKDKNGQYLVTIDTKNHVYKNKNLEVLHDLRRKNPQIRTFKEVLRELGIKQDRLDYAIFCGDFEIIDEYINAADKDVRYINISTPKNQEFIRKVMFEKELARQLKASQIESKQLAKITNRNLNSRLQALRMALVWEFMPNTRAIASMLARQDGYVSKLLAKEDDPNQELTNPEKARINAYRKEMYRVAGTEEQKNAFKQAAKIIKIYREKGLSAIDEKYLPIFERYGFILA